MKKFLGIAAALGAAALLIACGAGSPSTVGGSPRTAASTSVDSPAPVVETKVYPEPTTSNVHLKIQTLSKKCFGSAGCNISFTIKLSLDLGVTDTFDPAKTWNVTYDITGGEDPFTNTLELAQGDKYSTEDDQMISTKSSKSVLKVVITSITEQ